MPLNYNHTHLHAGTGENVNMAFKTCCTSDRIISSDDSFHTSQRCRFLPSTPRRAPPASDYPDATSAKRGREYQACPLKPHTAASPWETISLPRARRHRLWWHFPSAHCGLRSFTYRQTDRQPVLNTGPTRSGEVIACGGTVDSMPESNRKVKTDACGRNMKKEALQETLSTHTQLHSSDVQGLVATLMTTIFTKALSQAIIFDYTSRASTSSIFIVLRKTDGVVTYKKNIYIMKKRLGLYSV